MEVGGGYGEILKESKVSVVRDEQNSGNLMYSMVTMVSIRVLYT